MNERRGRGVLKRGRVGTIVDTWKQKKKYRKFFFIVRHLWFEKRLFVVSTILYGLGAAFEGIGLGLLVPFLDGLTDPEGAPFATGWAWFDQWVLAAEATPLERLYWISGLILTSVFCRAVIEYVARRKSVDLQENILARIRAQIIDQVLSVSMRFFATASTGQILNSLTSEIARLRNLLGTFTMIFINLTMITVYVVVILMLSWQLALIALLLAALVFGAVSGLISRIRERGRVISEANSNVASAATELISGIRTVNTSGAQRFEASRFETVNEQAKSAVVELGHRDTLVAPLSQSVASATLIGIVIIAVKFFVWPGLMEAATLLAFLFAFFRLLPFIKNLNGMRGVLANQEAALETVVSFLDRRDKSYLTDGTRDWPGLEAAIEFRNVSFAYETGQPVLTDINLTLQRGEVMAIVGASGGGKSTLADLLIRLYDPTEGQVLYDGVDVREYRLATLRDKISVVNQDTFLFNDTIAANIAYGLPEVPESKIREAARQANALDFIEAMKDGFDTVVGERGARLSGGQRQRIAIARAVLRDPAILVLDEATSALDSVSEEVVQDAMEALMEKRTVVVIAHRLATVKNADHVVVLEDGRVVEEGTYAELLSRRGQLWKYHSIQFMEAGSSVL